MIRRMKRKMRETVKRAKWRVVESSNTQHERKKMTHMKCAPHTLFLSQCQCDIKMCAAETRENETCEVCCSHKPTAMFDSVG